MSIHKTYSLRVLLLSLILIFCQQGFVLGQSNNSTIFRFLDVTPSAQAAAIGGNHPGIYAADYSLMHLNPAYLGGSQTGDVSATFVNYLADARMGFLNSAWKLDDKQRIGAGIRFLSYGDLDHFDEDGNKLGDLNAIDLALTGAYAINFAPKWNAGATFDLIHSSYLEYRSNAVAVSGGLYYKNSDEDFSFGISIRNLGTQISTFDDTREPMPLDISAGITKKPEGFPAKISVTLRRLNDWDMRSVGEDSRPDIVQNILRHVLIGGEVDMSSNFRLRIGYNHYLHELNKVNENFDFAGYAAGVGITIKDFIVDISRHSYSESGGIVQISIKTEL